MARRQTLDPSLVLARWLALAVPVGALLVAVIAQFGFDLAPCEMCWWQRYAHAAGAVFGLGAFFLRDPRQVRLAVWLAALGIAASGLIGGFHAGVEYHWWQGITTCSTVKLGGNPLDAILNAPIIRCDVAAWTLFGISMAGFNFMGSLAAALLIVVVAQRGPQSGGPQGANHG